MSSNQTPPSAPTTLSQPYQCLDPQAEAAELHRTRQARDNAYSNTMSAWKAQVVDVGTGPACRGLRVPLRTRPGLSTASRSPSAATVRSTPFIGEASETFLRLGRAQQIALRSDIRSRERQNMQDLPLHR